MNNKRPIHIYVYIPEALEKTNITILSDKERIRANSFKSPEDRHLYMSSHSFLRQKLSEHNTLPPSEWNFNTNVYGKPFIVNPGYEYIQFNLSHTQGMVACAINNGEPVGIDIEEYKPLQNLDELCRYVLSPAETYDVLSINNTEKKAHRFFTYWTLKESFIKAKGVGLSLPLRQFFFTKNENLSWKLTTKNKIESQLWEFKTRRINSYHLSVCTTRINKKKNEFIFHKNFKNEFGKTI